MVETVEQEQCEVCETYEIFNKLVASGIEPDFAFHVAVTQLVTSVVGEVLEETYDTGFEEEAYVTGYEEGYKQASVDIAEITRAYAESVNEE